MASSAASDEEIAICGLVASTDIGQIINFDEWTCDTGSQPTTDPCLNAWPGILCTSGFITSIDLNSVGMTGSISPNIGSLLTLQSLRLDENDMDGEWQELSTKLLFMLHGVSPHFYMLSCSVL